MRIEEDEIYQDKLLGIKTTGRDDSISTLECFPYEATPYKVLERIANSGLIRKNNTLLDYGCGKGRVDFYLSNMTKCRSIGIEYDERLYLRAMNNLYDHKLSNKVSFINIRAEEYEVPVDVDRIYFFNPFNVNIFKTVLDRVLASYHKKERQILMFFYFPSDEYIAYLMCQSEVMFYDEIDCTDIFNEDTPRERVMIFEIN